MNGLSHRSRYRTVHLTLIIGLVLTLLATGIPTPPTASAQVSITTLGSPYTQNFNTLANSGTSNPWSDNSTLEGWYATRQNGGTFTTYRADNGLSNTGALYSFGTSGDNERALGSIASGTPSTIYYGVRLRNDTGSVIASFDISYTGEQWRNGGNIAQHQLDFSYQTGATLTSLTSGTWNDVDALDFTGPITGSTASSLDGNASTNRLARTATITLTLNPNQEVMLRWVDVDNSGADHGLAIDDLSITANGSGGNPAIIPSCPTNLSTTAGTATSANLSARDPDGTVVSAQITSATVSGISLSGFSPAAGVGLTATVTLNVADTTAEGTYDVVVEFANNDGTPQTSACTVRVVVNPPPGSCPAVPGDAPLRSIPAIQGVGATSPFSGTNATIRGIVVGDFQGSTGLNGFFVQDPNGDSDPVTSDGIFVFIPAANSFSSVNVNVGDPVQISGQVREFGDTAAARTLTQIDFVTALAICGNTATISPTTVTLPENVEGELERYESMFITIPHTMTVSQNFFQGRFGQLTLSAGGRLYNPTNQFVPNSAEALALANENARRLLVLDDGRSSQNPNPIPYIGADNTLRAGDTVSNLTGLLDFGPINANSPATRDFRLHPTSPPSFTRVNERSAAPAAVGGNVKVASFNVLNYFTTIDQSGAQCFPSNTRSDCRGADSAAELERQRNKLVAALSAIDADVVGLMELENNGATAINDLVNALNAAMGANTYAAVADPANFNTLPGGGDAIKVALIYKPATVTPIGPAQAPNNAAFTIGRVPVAQTFHRTDNAEAIFTVIVNHFKSKSCSGATGADQDQGDGQSCFNATRVQQAEALLGFINDLQTSTGDNDVLVIGDLNAYNKEDPIRTLTTGGLVNELERFIPNPYSFIFDGLSGALDHALSTASLSSQITGVTEWHINTDEPSVIDYNTEFKPQDLYTPTPYRSSDHDPVIVGINVTAPPPNDTFTLYISIVQR